MGAATDEPVREHFLDRITELLFDKGLLLWIGLLVPIGVAAAYFYAFGSSGCCDQGTWGQFGDFFGGALNPLLAYFSLLALALTLREQRRLIEETRQVAVREELQRLIASTCETVEGHFGAAYRPGVTREGDSVYSIADICRNMSADDANLFDPRHLFGPTVPLNLRSAPRMRSAADRFLRLVRLCAEYLNQGGSSTVVQAYVGDYGYEAVVFHALWPTTVLLEHLELVGLQQMVPRAKVLAAKFADADACHEAERTQAPPIEVQRQAD